MPIRVSWAHLCDFAAPGQGSKPNLMGVFDRIGAQRFPAQHLFMVLAVELTGEPHETGHIATSISDTGGRVILDTGDQPVSISDAGKANHYQNFLGMVFPSAGIYSINIRLDGQPATRLPLTLFQLDG